MLAAMPESTAPPAPGGPPLWAILGTLLAAPVFVGVLIVYVPWTLTGWRFRAPVAGWEPTRWIGAALIVLAVPVLGDFLLRFVLEGHGTPVPVAPPPRLVVRGPYRFVRNPAYVAVTAAIAGQGLLLGSRDVLVYAAGMALAFHLLVVGHEEPSLRGKFGAAYAAYCRDVPRWIPRLRRRRGT
jgi:protein-S-isoprenylcysteine O-methyltransferase Ste14